jgi:hypothetical protein
MSQSVIDQDDLSPSIAYALADEPSAAYVIGCGTNKIFRLHPDISQTVIVDVPGPQESLHSLLPIPSIDGLLVGKVQSDVPILARVNFATIKNPTYSSTIRFYLVDSVNDTALMVFTHLSPANQVRHFNRLTWVSNGHNDFVNVDLNSYGGSNSLLNFGPYQYVISNHIILRSQIVHREMPTECAKHVKVD